MQISVAQAYKMDFVKQIIIHEFVLHNLQLCLLETSCY